LYRRRQQRLVRVLAVQIDQRRAKFNERAHCGRPAVDIPTRTADCGDQPFDHHLAARGRRKVESPRDSRRFGARADPHRVDAAAEQRVDRVDDERFACTGLARYRDQAPRELKVEGIDHAHISHAEFDQHCRSPIRELEFCLQDLMKALTINTHQPQRPRTLRTTDTFAAR
jgi:hypothetical protein